MIILKNEICYKTPYNILNSTYDDYRHNRYEFEVDDELPYVYSTTLDEHKQNLIEMASQYVNLPLSYNHYVEYRKIIFNKTMQVCMDDDDNVWYSISDELHDFDPFNATEYKKAHYINLAQNVHKDSIQHYGKKQSLKHIDLYTNEDQTGAFVQELQRLTILQNKINADEKKKRDDVEYKKYLKLKNRFEGVK